MIKVGYLVSYDYQMLFTSLKELYAFVDEIYLAIDINKKTWSGNIFELPDSFFNELNSIDISKKIHIYYDDFYVPSISPMECEIRERNLLLKKMGKGWLIQLDVDEYIYDFNVLAKYLKKYWYLNIFPHKTPIFFSGKLVTLYKKLPDGFLYIENDEKLPFVTNFPKYISARRNFMIRNFFTNTIIIHQSWARDEDEIEYKIKNWGHRDDFDTLKYLELWKSLNSSNYTEFNNFHPIVPSVWNKLSFIKSESIDEFIQKYALLNKQNLYKYKSKNKIRFFKNFILKLFKIK